MKQQRGQIEHRPNSEKQKMTESGRVDARAWNLSIKEGWEEVMVMVMQLFGAIIFSAINYLL
jgi:hypothetical protein